MVISRIIESVERERFMSIHTDLASIQIIAAVHKSQDLRQTFFEMVHKLQEKVAYFHWVGVYLKQGNEVFLEAATDMHNDLTWEYNSQLRIPIRNNLGEDVGEIVVKSRQPICFDVTDISTLETVAAEISQKLFLN